jgi:hypothetical protein
MRQRRRLHAGLRADALRMCDARAALRERVGGMAAVREWEAAHPRRAA